MKFVFTPISILLGLLAGLVGKKGAIFRLVKGLTDQGARRTFAKATGSWPGEEEPQPE